MRTVLVDGDGFELAAGPAHGHYLVPEIVLTTDRAGDPVLLVVAPLGDVPLHRVGERAQAAVDVTTPSKALNTVLGARRLAALRHAGLSDDEAHAGLVAWLAGGGSITAIRVRRILDEAGLLA